MGRLVWIIESGPELGAGACGVVLRRNGESILDISDSSGWRAEDAEILRALLADANAAEVYRKALEPVARAYADRGCLFGDVPVGKEWTEAIAEACRLMGIPLDRG
jgi:hypothetical protein